MLKVVLWMREDNSSFRSPGSAVAIFEVPEDEEKKLKTFLVFVLLLLSPAFSGFGYAIDFSADVVNTMQGQTSQSKIFVKKDKIRLETEGVEGYTILRMDKKIIWIVIPDEKTFIEVKSEQPGGSSEKIRGEVSRKYLSSEIVNGYTTKKYEVQYLDKKTLQEAYQWVATDLKYPIKISGVDGTWSTEYRNILVAKQPDRLFEVPEGFERVAKSEPSSAEPDPAPPAGNDKK